MKGPSPGNCQSANARQPAQSSTYDRARARSCRRALGGFGVFLGGEVLGAVVVGEKDRNIGVTESLLAQHVDSGFDSGAISINSECCCIFACHDDLLMMR